ncbi:MAG: AraC family transcriptional regulator, partial [Clostridia bacterium]|nr:AraC family transcriptional regulator [Clostridia bacterium]
LVNEDAIIIPPFTKVSFPEQTAFHTTFSVFSYYVQDQEFALPAENKIITKLFDDNFSVYVKKYFSLKFSEFSEKRFLKKALENYIIHCVENTIKRNETKIPRKLIPLISYIENNYSQNFTTSDLAKAANISESGVYKLFAHYLHESPKQYIRKCRISHATSLLLNTDMPITDIAIETGYYDQFYFSKEFKKEFGTSPSVYRKEKNIDKNEK